MFNCVVMEQGMAIAGNESFFCGNGCIGIVLPVGTLHGVGGQVLN